MKKRTKAPEPTEPQWCWKWGGYDDLHGPYATREEAIKAAVSRAAEFKPYTGRLRVGTCHYEDPADYAGMRVKEWLEQMNDRALEYGSSCDGMSVFKVRDLPAAQTSLIAALWAWAHVHVVAGPWTMQHHVSYTLEQAEAILAAATRRSTPGSRKACQPRKLSTRG